MPTRELLKPLIHLNGTGVDDLIKQWLAVDRAVCVTLDSLHQAVPNARDYYPLGDDAFTRAREQHREQVDKLVDVRHYANALLAYLSDQRDARDARRRR